MSDMTLPAPVMPIDHPLCRTIALPHLYDGERYAGIVLDDANEPSYHLILLPQQFEIGMTWDAAMEWAKSIGATLPTRQEQALLYANLKTAFRLGWYWSMEQSSDFGDIAWAQYSDNGIQFGAQKLSERGFGKAVRREVIQIGGKHA